MLDRAAAHIAPHSSSTSPLKSMMSSYFYYWREFSTVIFPQNSLQWLKIPSSSSTKLIKKLSQDILSKRFIPLSISSTTVSHSTSNVAHLSCLDSEFWDQYLFQSISPSSHFSWSLRAPSLPFRMHDLCST